MGRIDGQFQFLLFLSVRLSFDYSVFIVVAVVVVWRWLSIISDPWLIDVASLSLGWPMASTVIGIFRHFGHNSL